MRQGLSWRHVAALAHLFLAGMAAPSLAHRRRHPGGHARRGAGPGRSTDQRLGPVRVFRRGQCGQWPPGSGTARPQRQLGRRLAGAHRHASVGADRQPDSGGTHLGAHGGHDVRATGPTAGRGRVVGGGRVTRPDAPHRGRRSAGPLRGRCRVPQPRRPTAAGHWHHAGGAKRSALAPLARGRHGGSPGPAPAGDGHCRGPGTRGPRGRTQPDRPAVEGGQEWRRPDRRLATAGPMVAAAPRRRQRTRQQPIARLPGQPERAGAGGAVHGGLSRFFGHGPLGGAPPAAAGLAGRARAVRAGPPAPGAGRIGPARLAGQRPGRGLGHRPGGAGSQAAGG